MTIDFGRVPVTSYHTSSARNETMNNLLAKAAEALQNDQLDEAERYCQDVLRNDSEQPAAIHLAGMIAHRRDDYRQAIMLLEKSIQYNDKEASWHYNLALAYRAAKQIGPAIKSYCKAIELMPDYEAALYNLGAIYFERNRFDEAASCFHKTLKLNPDHVHANYELARIKHNKGNVFQALKLLDRAIRLAPDDADIRLLLTYALRDVGRYDDAMKQLDLLLQLRPDDENAVAVKASIFERLGKTEDAWQCLKPVIERGTDCVNVLTVYAELGRKTDRAEHALELFNRLLEQKKTKGEYRTMMHFAIARLLDNLGRYDDAFEHLKLANSRVKHQYDPQEQERKVSDLIETFSIDAITKLHRATGSDHRPVFIVGMPRSGTSLVEQILASHPQVVGTGESPLIANLANPIPLNLPGNPTYPQCVALTSRDQFDAMAGIYGKRLNEFSTQAVRLTDKTPLNFMHLGLISLIYPNTRIIHTLRNPMATCFSCFSIKFLAKHAYSYRLEDLGHFYRQHLRMMQHWYDVLEVPIMNMQYEELVTNPEPKMRKLVEFLDLSWDDACLKFYENKRPMISASYDQVRRPIYTSAINHWKNYEHHLAPLASALEG